MLPLLNEIPHLADQLSQKRTICLLFNFDEIEKSRIHTTVFLDQLIGLSRPPAVYAGIISQKSPQTLPSEALHHLINAGSNGFEIDGPNFSWKFPQLGMIYHQLEQLKAALTLEIGPGWAEKHVALNGTILTITGSPGDSSQQNRLLPLIRRELSDSILQAEHLPEQIRIYPAKPWNKRMLIRKIIDLLPRLKGLPPLVLYFGADISDEAAFREVNLYGYSILLRENIGRKTDARYYLRSNRELNRILIWFNAL